MTIPDLRPSGQTGEARAVIDPSNHVEVTVKALDMLGLVEGDRDEVREAIATEYAVLLGQVTEPGELYFLPPLEPGFTLCDMLTATDDTNFPEGRTYPRTHPLSNGSPDFSNRLWFPKDPTKEGYSTEEINRTDVAKDGDEAPVAPEAQARIALMNGAEPQDPILQLLGLPYDEMYAEAGQPTQLTELAKAQAEFAAVEANAGFELGPINAAGFVMLALQARIKGEELPINWGFMQIPQLGRKSVGGNSFVGLVFSNKGQLAFDFSDGRESAGIGVGFSVCKSMRSVL